MSVVRFKDWIQENDSLRFDSEFFKKEYLHSDNIIHKKGYKKLAQVTSRIDVGFVGSMVEHYNNVGVYLLQTRNIDAFFINKNEIIKVNKSFHDTTIKSQINFEDILIARSGSFGKASIYLEKNTINSSDIIIVKADSINPYFLVSYLNSKYGVAQMIRFASGGLQGHVNLTILESLEIPNISNSIQYTIQKIITNSYAILTTSQSLYTEAEELLLDELGLKDWQPSAEKTNIKSFKDSFLSTGRLDAEYYQPKYEEIESEIKNYKGGYKQIKDEFNHITTSFDKDKAGYYYIEIGDINIQDGISNPNFVETELLPANAKILAKKGDLIISDVRPNRGAISIIDMDVDNLIVSGAFTVLRQNTSSSFSIETLKILLRLNIYKNWLLKFNIGTQYPVIRDEDILSLPIPCLDSSIQAKIASLAQESFALKKESERLLEVAKQAVEIAIEQNEEVATAYIKENTR